MADSNTLTVDERYDARGYMFIPHVQKCRKCGLTKNIECFAKGFNTLKDGTMKPTRRRTCKDCAKTGKDLFLILTRHWFERVESRRKWYEFREATSYWRARLEGKEFRRVIFQMGYNKGAPRIVVPCSGIQRRKIKGREFYAIRIKTLA